MAPISVAIIGAGPAGLTAAYLLARQGCNVTVLEADATYVGGISRTVVHQGFHFDIGGHRFFSKSQEVEDFWTEILPDDMLERPRSSRIFYRGKFFSYPLKAFEAFLQMGVWESLRCGFSYAKARLFPIRNPRTFEDWVSNQFGSRLFQIFFKTYTEKVWGMSCQEISADWAAQRIKGLSLRSLILSSLTPASRRPSGKAVIKTLINSFRYPRKGPGMMWEECARKFQALGGTLRMGARVSRCTYSPESKNWKVEYQVNADGSYAITADHVISSAPMRELASMLSPKLSQKAAAAARALRYRDFLTVALVLPDRGRFPDNWIYIHDEGVKVGRIQNFKTWSPEMVPDPAMTCYGLEYFCFEGDGLWAASDEALIQQAKDELQKLGLAMAEDVTDGCVVRQAKAYPIYDDDYEAHVATLRDEMKRDFPTLHLVGRNGMHKYNNQDHSMMTAMLCARNILAGKELFDLWQVNGDAEYHESGSSSSHEAAKGFRHVPESVS